MKMFKKLAIITLASLFLIGLPVAISAADESAGVELAEAAEEIKDVYAGPDEIIEGNFIKVGNSINIEAAVRGDVIVAGNTVTISGPVAGDVIAAGNIIRIKGPVVGSVRVLGSFVEIDNEVEHNVWAVGNSVILGENAKVGWDVYSAGSVVEINGAVDGNGWLAGASVVINGRIGKDVEMSLDTGGQAILSPSSEVAGNLTYHASSEEQIILQEGSVISGEVVRKSVVKKNVGWPFRDRDFGLWYIFSKIISFFGLLVVGVILTTLIPKVVWQVKEEMNRQPGRAILWGLICFFLLPIVSFLLLFTFIGIPLALILFAGYFISLFIAKILVAFALGVFLLDYFGKSQKYGGSLTWPLVFGLIIFLIITAIPFIGWLIKLILIWWALGAALQVKQTILKELR